MRRLCRFFTIFILACTVAACSSEPEGDIDTMWTVLSRQEYPEGYRFVPNADLAVWGSSQGKPKRLSLDDVKVKLAEKPLLSMDGLIEIKSDGKELNTPGTNLIIVEYESFTAISPMVVSPKPPVEPPGPPGGGGEEPPPDENTDTGPINIIWN